MPDDDVLLCLDLSVRLSVCLPVSVSPHSFPIGIRIRSCFTHSVPSASLPLRAVFTSLCWPAKRILCHFLLIASYIESWRGGKKCFLLFPWHFLLLTFELGLVLLPCTQTHTCFSLGFQWVASAAVSVMRESFTRPSDIPVQRGTTAGCLFAFSSVRFPLLPLLL